jgi:hemolysin activation/secretion protein
MTFSILGGYTVNARETKKQFPYAESTLGFTLKVTNNEKLVLATRVKGKALFNNNYEFYQAATVGGDFDLRGFRNQRFSGKQSFYHSSDLRFNLGKLKNTIAPVRYGVFGGFDYGRVWIDNDNSEKWHQSYGGGLWINGINIITGQISVFNSTDGLRVAVGVGFGL